MIYTVQPGDYLAKIARDIFGDYRLWKVLAKYNSLSGTAILVGQELIVPAWLPRCAQFPLTETETNYFKFGTLYPPGHRWAGTPHPGVDFHEQEGAEVHAIADGVVVRTGYDASGYGTWVMIAHMLSSGVIRYSLYGHMQRENGSESLRVGRGTVVLGGSTIGSEGKTGAAGGLSHLHFEYKKTPELGLYGKLTLETLREWFGDPYVYLPQMRYMPVETYAGDRDLLNGA